MKNSILFLVFLILFAGCETDKSQGEWIVTKAGQLPEAVSNQAVSEGFINGSSYLYSFGGIDSTKAFSGIHRRSYRYDIERGIAERIQDVPDTLGKIASAATRINNVIYILGGYHVYEDGREKSSDRVHRYDIVQNRFIEDGANIPIPIDDHVQFSYKNRYIYVITGWSEKENVSAVQIYDSKEDAWLAGTPVPDNDIFKSFGASGTISGDTIYYLGGASMGKHFPIQSVLRKGVIDMNDPTRINWSSQILDERYAGYRMGSFERNRILFWIGGSDVTYNFNALAYDGGEGVEPNHRILSLSGKSFEEEFYKNIPMDLRGIANIDDSVKYVVGGIAEGQQSSDAIIKLEWKE